MSRANFIIGLSACSVLFYLLLHRVIERL